jgi:hypothetical protein
LLLIFLLCIVITAVAWLKYREQLINLVFIWQETFPAETQATNSVRGTIYDRNFKELALTLERVSLYVRPREVNDIAGTAAVLAELLALPESELITRMQRDSHLVWLRRDIGQEDEDAVAKLNLPGIYLHRELARSYPMQEYASHLIGNSEKGRGFSGVEHYYNRLLNHDRVLQEDIPAIDLKGQRQTSSNGHDLVLTLDMKIQAILEKYVAGLGKKMGSGRITSLLLDTAQGEIIAGVSYPSYNLNSVWQNEKEVLDTLFLTPMVVPEEIRKFFRDASLLQGGWEQATQVYPWSLVSDTISFSRQIRLWNRLQLTTDLNVDFSSNKKKLTDLQQYVGCLPTLDLGSVPKTAAPLKVLLGMTHLLNGGKKIQPHILDRIMERPDQRSFFYDIFHGQSSGKNVFPSLISKELRRLLKSQGRSGVLGSISLSGDTVSLVKESPNTANSFYVRDRMALIMIPAEKPELILLLAARSKELEPGVGSSLLCNTLDSVLPSMVALQQISHSVADVLEIEGRDERNFKAAENKFEVKTEGSLAGMLDQQILLMPDLKGFSIRKSLRLLQRVGVSNITVKGTGRIVSQSPKAGKAIKKGEHCVLTLATDKVPRMGTSEMNLSIE